MPNRPFVHIEFSASDPAKAARFYGDLFGWEIHHMAEYDYWTFDNEPNHGGGFNTVGTNPSGFETKPGDVIAYVDVEDLDASLTKAEELGAQVIQKRVDMPGMGAFAILRDPQSNLFGMWWTEPRAEGASAGA